MNELTLGGKTYVSSKRAAEISGYAKDYVGQLCREGHVEAKMVGRSWYVLEESIRDHRFGTPETKLAQKEKKVEEEHVAPVNVIPVRAWESPRYEPEISDQLPKLTQRSSDEASAAISDMQAAWKEWFEKKQEPLLESPEVIDAREAKHEREEDTSDEPEIAPYSDEEDEEVAIPLNRLETVQEAAQEPVEERDGERHIEIHRIQRAAPPPVHAMEAPVRPRAAIREERQRTSLVINAALVAIACVAIVVAVVGSGYVESYESSNPALRFLGGASTINNTNN